MPEKIKDSIGKRQRSRCNVELRKSIVRIEVSGECNKCNGRWKNSTYPCMHRIKLIAFNNGTKLMR